MKKIVLTLVCTLVVIFNLNIVFASEDVNVSLNKELPIKFNNEYLTFYDANQNEVYPISYEGTTYLPVRALSSAFRKGIQWYGAENMIVLGEGEVDTSCSRVTSAVEKNGTINIVARKNTEITIYLDWQLQTFKDANGSIVYPISYEGTTYLPVRAISNIFGAKIEWLEDTKEIEIVYEEKIYMDPEYIISEGIYVNKAGEIIKYYSKNGGEYIGSIYTTKDNILPTVEEEMKHYVEEDRYSCYVTEYDSYMSDNPDYSSCPKIVIVAENIFSSDLVDTYIVAPDGYSLISQMRGSDFDLIKTSDICTAEEYLSQEYIKDSSKNKKYECDGKEYTIIELKNYAAGQRKAIEVTTNDVYDFATDYYKEEDLTNVEAMALSLYLKDANLSEISEIYSYYYYANYYCGIFYYTDGSVWNVSMQLKRGEKGPDVQIDSFEKMNLKSSYNFNELVQKYNDEKNWDME